ncbi:MAG: hypothetical protein GY778_27840 [bacterium]|nr:hypothetical protein [bacterium]
MMALLAARARRISTAEEAIRGSLQDNLFSDVGHTDLVDVAEIVNGLDPGEASAVIAGLSDHELGVWMRELDGWRGGFNAHEEARLFSDLAAKLGPAQLARLIAHGKTEELMGAVAAGSPPTTRVELALMLWAGRSPNDRGWERIIELVESASFEEVEEVVGGRSLSELTGDLVGVHRPDPEGPARFRLDAMLRFVGVAAGFADARLKAQLFTAVMEQLSAQQRSDRIGDVRVDDVLGRLSHLVRTDTAAVVAQLNHAIDPHGNVLAEWIQRMIEADRLDELDVLLAELIGGEDRLAHFTDPGPDPARPYPNAANLGYYVGAYGLAIDGIADDAEDQISLVEQLFAIVTGIVPGPDRSKVRLPIGPLVELHAESVVDGFRAQATSLKQTLWDLAKPRTEDGLLWNGTGTTQFQDAWEEVVLVR